LQEEGLRKTRRFAVFLSFTSTFKLLPSFFHHEPIRIVAYQDRAHYRRFVGHRPGRRAAFRRSGLECRGDDAGAGTRDEEAVARFGRIDALVNNAGYGQYGLFEAIPPEKVREQFEVNVFGVMDVTRALLPHFRKNRGGVIVNVSSGAGIFTLPMISLYCASKFALEGFSEALAYELASQNIAVKIVQPHGGVTATAFNDRSAKDNASDPALADYDDFVGRTREAFATSSAARTISSEDVARVIYDAATDGTPRLRYLVGNDARGFIKARRELPDQDYVDFMRSHFSKP